MIYRAICYSTHDRMCTTPETVVFFQGGARDDTAARLCRTLAEIWHVSAHTVEFYNLHDEPDYLRTRSAGRRVATPDSSRSARRADRHAIWMTSPCCSCGRKATGVFSTHGKPFAQSGRQGLLSVPNESPKRQE